MSALRNSNGCFFCHTGPHPDDDCGWIYGTTSLASPSEWHARKIRQKECQKVGQIICHFCHIITLLNHPLCALEQGTEKKWSARVLNICEMFKCKNMHPLYATSYFMDCFCCRTWRTGSWVFEVEIWSRFWPRSATIWRKSISHLWICKWHDGEKIYIIFCLRWFNFSALLVSLWIFFIWWKTSVANKQNHKLPKRATLSIPTSSASSSCLDISSLWLFFASSSQSFFPWDKQTE